MREKESSNLSTDNEWETDVRRCDTMLRKALWNGVDWDGERERNKIKEENFTDKSRPFHYPLRNLCANVVK